MSSKINKFLLLSLGSLGLLTCYRYDTLKKNCIRKQIDYFALQIDISRLAQNLETITWLRRASAVSDLEQKRLIRQHLNLYDPSEIYIKLSE